MKFEIALTSATLLAVVPCRSAGQALANQALPGPTAKVGQILDNGNVVKAVTKEWTALEKTGETSGEFLFVEAGGKVTRIKKTLGAAGPNPIRRRWFHCPRKHGSSCPPPRTISWPSTI